MDAARRRQTVDRVDARGETRVTIVTHRRAAARPRVMRALASVAVTVTMVTLAVRASATRETGVNAAVVTFGWSCVRSGVDEESLRGAPWSAWTLRAMASNARGVGARAGAGDGTAMDVEGVERAIDAEACWFGRETAAARETRRRTLVVETKDGTDGEGFWGVVEAWARESGARARGGRLEGGGTARGRARALAGRDGATELFDRAACFGEDEASGFVMRDMEKTGVDAETRARALVERELACFVEGARAFAQSDAREATALVELEGASYVAKRFGHMSDVARWSAEETHAAVGRALSAMRAEDGVQFVAVLARRPAPASQTSRATERRLLGVDSRRRATETATHDDDDPDALANFTRKAVQWATVIIFIGAAFGGVLALNFMPVVREPLLYPPIPGMKFD